MKLIKGKLYTKCMLRLYEEDYSDIDVLNLINELKDKLSVKVTCAYHTKDNAKPHYHLILTNGVFRSSALYKLGLKEHECSNLEDTKGAYFYITKHKGKEEEDKDNNHDISVLVDEHNFLEDIAKNENEKANDFLTWFYSQDFEKPFPNVASFVRFVHTNASKYDTFVASHIIYITRILNI